MCPPPLKFDKNSSFLPDQNFSNLVFNNSEIYQPIYPTNNFGQNSLHHRALSIPESSLHHPGPNTSTDFFHQIYHPNNFDQNSSYLSSYGNTSSLSYTNTDVYQAMSIRESSLHHSQANGQYQPITNNEEVYQALSVGESSLHHPEANGQYQPLTTPGSQVHHEATYEEYGQLFIPGSVSYHEAGYSPMNFAASFGHQQVITLESFGQYQAANEPQPPLTIPASFGQNEAIDEQYQPMIVQASLENHQGAIEQYLNEEYSNPYPGTAAINQTFADLTTEQRQQMNQHRAGEGDVRVTQLSGHKPRLHWTPELHAEFLSAVSDLGGLFSKSKSFIFLKILAILI